MKQPIVYMASFALLFLTACTFIAKADEGEKKASASHPPYQVDIRTEIEELDEYHMTVHFPETPNNQIDQTIIDYINQKKAEFKQKSYQSFQEIGKARPHELHIDFEVLYQDGNFFVVRFIETMDVGRADISVEQTVMNFNKDQGNRIEVDEFFKENVNYVHKMADFAINELSDKVGENRMPEFQHQVSPLAENYQNLAWTGEGFVLFLNHSQKGWDKITVGHKSIKKLLQPDYAKVWLDQSSHVSDKKNKIVSVSDPVEISSSSEKVVAGQKVALTFEDGPHPEYTKNVLEVLDHYQVEATFFMIGKRVKYYPEVAQAVVEQGHEIGNHSWSHPRLSRLNSSQVEEQIASTQKVIEEATGQKPDLLRLPFGDKPVSPNQTGLNTIPLTVDSEEWQTKEPKQIAAEVISQVESGSVIVLQQLQPSTIEAIEIVIKQLSEQGYQFVKASQLQIDNHYTVE